MAKGSEKPAEEGAPKKGNKLLLIVLALLILLGGGGGFGYWFFMVRGADHGAKAQAQEEPEVPTYTALDSFTVNLKDPGVALQAAITLKVHDEKVGETIKLRMPEIRDQVVRILSNQQSSDLLTAEGKEKLGKQISLAVNKILGVKVQKEGVSQVLFTSFIIQ